MDDNQEDEETLQDNQDESRWTVSDIFWILIGEEGLEDE